MRLHCCAQKLLVAVPWTTARQFGQVKGGISDLPILRLRPLYAVSLLVHLSLSTKRPREQYSNDHFHSKVFDHKDKKTLLDFHGHKNITMQVRVGFFNFTSSSCRARSVYDRGLEILRTVRALHSHTTTIDGIHAASTDGAGVEGSVPLSAAGAPTLGSTAMFAGGGGGSVRTAGEYGADEEGTTRPDSDLCITSFGPRDLSCHSPSSTPSMSPSLS